MTEATCNRLTAIAKEMRRLAQIPGTFAPAKLLLDAAAIDAVVAEARMTHAPYDPRYAEPVAGLDPIALKATMQRAALAVVKEFPPRTGVIVFAFDFTSESGRRGFTYASNAERGDCLRALKEWIRNVEGRN